LIHSLFQPIPVRGGEVSGIVQFGTNSNNITRVAEGEGEREEGKKKKKKEKKRKKGTVGTKKGRTKSHIVTDIECAKR
jgi:hypothetical protein